jgi:hypothetical protein
VVSQGNPQQVHLCAVVERLLWTFQESAVVKKTLYLFTPKHRCKVSLIARVVPLRMGWIEVRGFSRYV